MPEDVGSGVAEIYRVVGPVYRRAQRTVENAEHVEGASVGVRAVLDMLAAHGPMTVPDMGRAQALSRQFVQRMVNDAAGLGWVRAVPNPAHKRSSLIELTAAGRRIIRTIAAREHRAMAEAGAGLSPAEIETCLRVLRQMLESLDPLED